MSDDAPIADLILRIRQGDGRAAEDLVRRYEPMIRREVRFRLEDPRLRRMFDSMDVCQSVLASFFVRAAAGQYDLDDSSQLPKLLVSIARNKVASAARRQTSARRDHRRGAGEAGLEGAIDPGESPSVVVAGAELLDRFRSALSDEERALADLRAAGLSWTGVAERMGGNVQARRMQLSRAVDRVAKALGLDDTSDE
jgi:RNA polymerase sigma-70 factor (ECF subfamily)